MSTITNFKSMGSAFTGLSRIGLSLMFSGAILSTLAFPVGAALEPLPPVDPPSLGEPGPRTSIDRSGTLQTGDGLTLHLTTDVGSVRVVALDPGAPPVVGFTAHIETDAHAPLAQSLLDRYSLTAKTT